MKIENALSLIIRMLFCILCNTNYEQSKGFEAEVESVRKQLE